MFSTISAGWPETLYDRDDLGRECAQGLDRQDTDSLPIAMVGLGINLPCLVSRKSRQRASRQ